jgi:hypothetical protein
MISCCRVVFLKRCHPGRNRDNISAQTFGDDILPQDVISEDCMVLIGGGYCSSGDGAEMISCFKMSSLMALNSS